MVSSRMAFGSAVLLLSLCIFTVLNYTSHHITSHHMEKTEAGLKDLCIREITTVIGLLIRYY